MSGSLISTVAFLLAGLIISPCTYAVHKCVNENGGVTLSNLPCKTGQEQIILEGPLAYPDDVRDDELSKPASVDTTEENNTNSEESLFQQSIALAYISEGFSASAEVKVHIAEYFATTGQFPSSNREINLPAPEKYKGQSLKSIRVSRGGVITLSYDEKSGVNNGTILLVPHRGDSALGIKWQCSTPSYKSLGRMAPQCQYTL